MFIWWKNASSLKSYKNKNIMISGNNIDRKTPSRNIYSDVSNSGWVATSGNKTGGPFSLEGNKYHLNAKELLAVKFAWMTFVNIKSTCETNVW